MRPAWLLLPTLLATTAAAAGEAPSYETRDLTLTARVSSVGELRIVLRAKLRENRLKLVQPGPDGVEKASVAKLPLPAVAAVLVAITHDTRGAELDLAVSLDGPRLPVTVTWEGRTIQVEVGPEMVPQTYPALGRDAVGARYGLGPLGESGGARWSPGALHLLDSAIGRLSDDERALLEGLAFVRVPEASVDVQAKLASGQGDEPTAVWAHDGRGTRVEVYDRALEPFTHFVGAPDDPQPMGLFVLLHEVGHAVSEYPRVRLYAALSELGAHYNARGEALAAAVADRNLRKDALSDAALAELDRGFDAESEALAAIYPLLEAIEARLADPSAKAEARMQATPGLRPATWYARTGEAEFFAEAFALYHADRAALERISPECVAWFDAGEHLVEARRDQALLARAHAAMGLGASAAQ